MTYDLSGLSTLQATMTKMAADQSAGKVKFSGGYQVWTSPRVGMFKAIVSVGGALVPTTTACVLQSMATLNGCLALLASTCDAAAIAAARAVFSPPIAYAAGKAPWEPAVLGPVTTAAPVIQNTSYDLSGIASAQAAVNAMIDDKNSGAVNFNKSFLATLTPGGAPVTTTLGPVLAIMREINKVLATLNL